MMRLLARFAENPCVNLLAGVILLVTAGIEIVQNLEQDVIGVHHGVAVFAGLQILRVLPELVHGAEKITAAGK